jgi:hypothetical protein
MVGIWYRLGALWFLGLFLGFEYGMEVLGFFLLLGDFPSRIEQWIST